MDWIPRAEFSYNTSTHSSTKITPFEVVYGIPPPHPLTYVPGTAKVQAIEEYLQDRDSLLHDLRRNLRLAQERMTNHANQWRREVSFEVGDYVYLKLQPYHHTTVAFRSSLKLSPRLYRPFQILSKVSLVAYQLDLPKDCQIHNVFHVSLLRKHLGSITPLSSQLPPLANDSSILPQPASILARREIQKGKYLPKAKVLVKWVGASDDDATWKNEWRFFKSYPHFRP
jgi:hypothetical protein